METQVKTMKNENSGIDPKLRTYAAIRGITLHRSTYASGTGTTLDLSHHAMGPASKTDGYWVGGETAAHIIPLPSDVRPFIKALSATYTAQHGVGYVGVWKASPDATEAIVEGVEWFADLDAATFWAKVNHQDAIYDIANQRDIIV